MVPADTSWARAGWSCSDPLAPLLSFLSKYFSVLVLINHCLSPLHLWMKELVVSILVFFKGLSTRFSLDNLLQKITVWWGTSCRKVLPLPAKALEANDQAVDGSYERYLWADSAFDLGLSLFEEGSPSKRHALRTWRVVLLWGAPWMSEI